MILSFTLSMPNIGSWNGKWTGAKNLYAITENIRSKKQAQKILDKEYYHYDFGDGWSAGVTVNSVTAKKAAKLRKASNGFCGYEWMIKSIKLYGDIRS